MHWSTLERRSAPTKERRVRRWMRPESPINRHRRWWWTRQYAARTWSNRMYRECFVCGRDFGENASIAHLRIGRRIAFDVERGRLWIVCRRCGQWCLTPVEDRWEAIEECEALFRGAEARVSTANVGLARFPDVELVRIGSPERDEIANWRYGPRFERRKRRAKIVGGVLGALTGLAIVGALYVAS